MGLDKEKISTLIYNMETAANQDYKEHWVVGVPLRKEEEDAKAAMEATGYFISKYLHQDDFTLLEEDGVLIEEPEFEEEDKVSIEELENGLSGVSLHHADEYTKVLNKYQNRVEKDSVAYQQLNKQRILTATYNDVINRVNGYKVADEIVTNYEKDVKKANEFLPTLEGIEKFARELIQQDDEEFLEYEEMHGDDDEPIVGSELFNEPYEEVYQNQYKRVMDVFHYTEKLHEVDFEEELNKLNSSIKERMSDISFKANIKKVDLEEYFGKSLKELEDLTNQDLHQKYQQQADSIAKDVAKTISQKYSPYVLNFVGEAIDACIKGKEGFKTENELKAQIVNNSYHLYNNPNADLSIFDKVKLADDCWETVKKLKVLQEQQVGEMKRASILKDLADLRVLEAKKNALISARKDEYEALCKEKIDDLKVKPEDDVRKQLGELGRHLNEMHKTGRMNTTEYKEFKKALLAAADDGDIDKAYETARKYIEEKTSGGKEPSTANGKARLSVARAVYAICGTYAKNNEFYARDMDEMRSKIVPISFTRKVDGRDIEQKDLIAEAGIKNEAAEKKIEEFSGLNRELNPEEKSIARQALIDKLVKEYININLMSPIGRKAISELKINEKLANSFIDEFKKKIESKGMIPPANEITKDGLKNLSERNPQDVIFGQRLSIVSEKEPNRQVDRTLQNPVINEPSLGSRSVLGN